VVKLSAGEEGGEEGESRKRFGWGLRAGDLVEKRASRRMGEER
jgi:hypothetical protein